MRTVAVVDYGMGNLRSVSNAVRHVAVGSGFEVIVTAKPEDVRAAERVVLPGQGAMPDCMRELRDSGLMQSVREAAAAKPLFGVCVGMQMMLDRSDEGPTAGLGLIHGQVIRFELASSPMAAATRCRKWAGTASRRRSRTHFGPASRTKATSTSSTVSTRARQMRATA
jgi:imidazole glycerol phosphate synthase glutamine amidotransferase subunit